MAMTAYMMVNMRGKRLARSGEVVITRADKEAAWDWVKSCREEGNRPGRVGVVMTTMGA